MSSVTALSAGRNGATARLEFAGIAAGDVGQYRVVVGLFAALDEFEGAPLRPRRWTGGDKDFDVRVGTNYRANVPPIEHRAARTRRESALRLDQRRAELRGIAATTEAASPIWRVRNVASLKSVSPNPRATATAAASS